MKELEALERIRKCLPSGYNMLFSDEFKLIKQALTPPTSEEVCRQLSEYLRRPIIYIERSKSFQIKCVNGNYEIVRLHGNNEISFDTTYCLPPSLITLIGRFYQGVKK